MSEYNSDGGLKIQLGCVFLLIGIFLFLGFLLIGHNLGWAFGSLGLFSFLYFLYTVASNSSSQKSHVAGCSTTTNTNTVSYNTHIDNAIHQSQANDLYRRISDDTKYHFSKLDPLLIDAIVVSFADDSTISISTLQRRLGIGFNYAGRLMAWMEKMGLVSSDGSGNRILLVSSEDLPIALDSIDLSELIETNNENIYSEVNKHINNMSNTIDLSSGNGESKRVKVNSFSEKYLPVTDIPLADKITQAILCGADYALVDVALIKELDKKLAAHKKAEYMLHETARLNNMGIEAEKDGRIFDALEAYEKNIALGGRALHAYERLRILYHKAKDYENEIRVIRRMMEVYEISPSDENNWWVKRLAKIEALLNKTLAKKAAKDSPARPIQPSDEPINIFWTD